MLLWTYTNGEQICFETFTVNDQLGNPDFHYGKIWEVIDVTKDTLVCIGKAERKDEFIPPLCQDFQIPIPENNGVYVIDNRFLHNIVQH